MKYEQLTYGAFYHIYNRGNNSCDLFREEENYRHFLDLYDRYISPVAETYAWVLMPNHFHLLVRIKREHEIGYIPYDALSGSTTAKRLTESSTPSEVSDPDGGLKVRKYRPANQFSHLFNAYAQAFNRRHDRTGSLFERSFKRKKIDNPVYLKNVVVYIHQNPVHHGFCEHPLQYPWSSYMACTSTRPTKLKRAIVLDWFERTGGFVQEHRNQIDHLVINQWLRIEPDYYIPNVRGDEN